MEWTQTLAIFGGAFVGGVFVYVMVRIDHRLKKIENRLISVEINTMWIKFQHEHQH